MPENQPTPDLVPIIIVLHQDAAPKSEETTQALEKELAACGVTGLNLDRLPLFGIITGTAPADQLDTLRKLPEIESVEPDETMHLRDDTSDPGSAR